MKTLNLVKFNKQPSKMYLDLLLDPTSFFSALGEKINYRYRNVKDYPFLREAIISIINKPIQDIFISDKINPRLYFIPNSNEMLIAYMALSYVFSNKHNKEKIGDIKYLNEEHNIIELFRIKDSISSYKILSQEEYEKLKEKEEKEKSNQNGKYIYNYPDKN